MGRIVAVFLILTTLAAVCLIAVPHARAAGASADSWTAMTPMPTGRIGLGVAVVNGKIYAIGGDTGANQALNANEMYDPATDTWTTKAPMPTARSAFGIAVYQNKIYCIGGRAEKGSLGHLYLDNMSINEVYDPATDTWTAKTPMPTKRFGLTASVVDGKIYLIGGTAQIVDFSTPVFHFSSSVFGLNEAYDPATDTWTTKAPLPTAVYGYASAVVDGRIYVFGGEDYTDEQGVIFCNFTQIYSPQTDSWSQGAPVRNSEPATAAAATTGVYAPKRIYVLGGGTSLSISYLNRMYDPETGNWSFGAPMPMRTYGLGVAVVDDVLYALGAGVSNERYVPVGYGTVPPVVSVLSPGNGTVYASGNVSLAYAVNKPYAQANYSLDGQDNVTASENTTLTGLTGGAHNVTVYATDAFNNTGASETVTFNVVEKTETEPFPTTWIIVAVVVIASLVGAAVLAYIIKVKRRQR